MSFSEEPGVSHQVPKILHSHVQDSMDSMDSCSAYIYIHTYIKKKQKTKLSNQCAVKRSSVNKAQ